MHNPEHMIGLNLTATQIARACGGRVVCGDAGAAADGVSTDTRALRPGQAFFALVGPSHDAHSFLPEATAGGAAVFVVQRLLAGWVPPAGAAVVQVPDTGLALLALASWRRQRLDAKVAAVTGSYGKSTVKDMLGAILARNAKCTTAPASYNNRIGVALTLLSAAQDDDFVVLEMGTNHPGEIDELGRAAQPDIGVITAIGEVHLEGLGSLQGVKEAKAELIPHLSPQGTLVLNADDALCASLAGRFTGRTCTFGLSPDATVRAQRIHPSGQGWEFDALGWVFGLPATARYNVVNAAAAICAATSLGASLRSAAEALAEFRPPPMRYERIELAGVTFICDCYNNNPPAMHMALQSFVLERNPGRKIVVCADMLELGAHGPRLHREVGREIAESGVQILVAVGPLARHLLDGWHSRALPHQRALYFESAQHAWSPLLWEVRPGDAVLLKGSRAMRLETITENIAAHLATAEKGAAA